MQRMSESSTEIHGEVRMIVGSVNQAMSSTCIVSCMADLYIHSVCTVYTFLHYIRVSDVCSVASDNWVLSI